MSHDEVKCVPFLERLVAFDTTSRNSNLQLIEYLRDYLAGFGIDSELTYDDRKQKANLFATIGPAGVPGIMLSGHTDVVPVDGQDWNTDPYLLTRAGGRLYGRGSADMKGYIAACLALVPDAVNRDLHTPLHLSLSYDEEVGCVGVRRLIARLAEHPVQPRACIVGEPTELRVIRGHKGKRSVRCRVRGLECHSGLAHRGVNAVEAAAEVVAYLKSMARRFRDGGPYDAAFEPPYTSVHTGVLHGGTALNIVPKEATFDFEFRHLPADDPQALAREIRSYAKNTLLPEMHAVCAETGFSWDVRSAFPGLDTDPDAQIVRLVCDLVGDDATGKVSFGTEGGLFHQAGIPCVVCGPGSIMQAHKPDEFVEVDQLRRCEAFLQRLLDHVSMDAESDP
jgi:acetylornithine deacetylase